jgi:hypothetical protein
MTTTVPTQPTGQPSEQPEQEPAGEVLHCANHPDVETYLRCNKCNKPICLKCAELTEVGYRCKECIREQQNVFYNAMESDNLIAFAVAAGITLVAWPIVVLLLGLVGSLFWILSWILAAVLGSGAGASLAQIIRKSVGRRRGRYIRHFTLAGIVIGLVLSLFLTNFIMGGPLLYLPALLFGVLAVGSAYQLLK